MLLAAVAVPVLAGLWLVAAGRGLSRRAALDAALLVALASAGLLAAAMWFGDSFDRAWISAIGIRLSLGIDGISAPLLVLTTVIGLLVVVLARSHTPAGGAPATYLGAVLIATGGALATFAARDAVVFFIAFELVLIPVWLLIHRFGDPHDENARRDAGLRFVLFTVSGSVLMLVGILALVSAAGTSSLDELVAAGATLPLGTQTLVAVLLVAGLAVKVPVFPLHTWLPAAHTTAPTGGSVILAAILLKMGTYGLVRLPVASVPDGFGRIAPVLAVLAAIGIVWGGLVCLVEVEAKRLIAYSSVAHMGFVTLALASGTEVGVQAALIGNIAHGVVSALLFVVIGGLKERWGAVRFDRPLPALREHAPRLGFVLILGLAAALGLPGLAAFWGEFMAIYAAWTSPLGPGLLLKVCAALAALGAVLAAAYALRVARLLWVGETDEPAIPTAADGSREGVQTETLGSERLVLTVLVLAVVAIGIAPHLVWSVTAEDVRVVMTR
ncbi:MAG: NADH-quinone oxidoreductase subunit M [Intrasporangiaceae bacterium]|nr:NADH-quinone oxidoreductase subunit M [Intrasporangiaceae bacterium]